MHKDVDMSTSESKHIAKPSRNELTLKTSEFHLAKQAKRKPLVIKDLVKILSKTASHADIGKKLEVAEKSVERLQKPLDKVEVEKAARAVGFEEIKKKLSRWDAIVTKNRASDHLVYPLERPNNRLQDTKQFLSKFQVKSDLEKELDALDAEIKIEKRVDENDGDFTLTLAEMIEQRKEGARLRARQAYQAAKGKRQNKIKSKKFHRIEKRNRMKQKLREFEELQKTNPEEALRQLETIEKARAVERVTLRHKNTGQWAKSKLVRAKYDKETRQQLAEQLAVSRELTQKIDKADESDASEDEAPRHIEDPSNPWMNPRETEKSNGGDIVSGYRKYWEEQNKKAVSTSAWIVEDLKARAKMEMFSFEDDATVKGDNNAAAEVAKRIKLLKEATAAPKNKQTKHNNKRKSDALNLEFKPKNNKVILDERLNETSGTNEEIALLIPNNKRIGLKMDKHIAADIDPNKFVNIKPRVLPTALPDELDRDLLDDDEEPETKIMNIQEAFEEDDIVAEFRHEKEDEVNKSKPKPIDLSLPGWGSWGGKNLKPTKRKRKRFIVKAPPPEKRRDENKGDIIIKEFSNAKLQSHKVTDVPFPFTSVNAFEATVRAPIGNTFIPESAFKKLIKPTVITKMGAIIEPMTENQLINYKNKKGNNSSINEAFINISN